MFDNLILYYFTGTGNARAAANWIGEIAEELNIRVIIHEISPSLDVNGAEIPERTLIGFCYPTHGFNAPPVVINFCLRFPKLKNRIFILNTRAGLKLSQLFLPGISGVAQLIPALILRAKGFRITALQPLDLPSNWIFLHPGLKQKAVDSIFARCKPITKKFAHRILSGEKAFKGLISLPLDLLISPISLGYYLIGRFALSKTFVPDNSCNACEKCKKECPVKAIKMKNNRPFWTWKCESCMHCINICPQRAIQSPHLFVIILWWLTFSVVPMIIMKELLKTGDFISRHFDLFFDSIIVLSSLPIIFGSYRFLHYFMRYRFFNWLIRCTSLTRFKFWRRYNAPEKY